MSSQNLSKRTSHLTAYEFIFFLVPTPLIVSFFAATAVAVVVSVVAGGAAIFIDVVAAVVVDVVAVVVADVVVVVVAGGAAIVIDVVAVVVVDVVAVVVADVVVDVGAGGAAIVIDVVAVVVVAVVVGDIVVAAQHAVKNKDGEDKLCLSSAFDERIIFQNLIGFVKTSKKKKLGDGSIAMSMMKYKVSKD